MCFIATFNSGPVEGVRSWLGQTITFPTENVSYKKCCNLGQNFLSVFFPKSTFRSSLDNFLQNIGWDKSYMSPYVSVGPGRKIKKKMKEKIWEK